MKKIRFTIKEVVYQLIYCTTFFLHPCYICIQSHIHIFTDVKRLSARLELSLPGNFGNISVKFSLSIKTTCCCDFDYQFINGT